MTTRILGIESSCDETAAAVVVDGREILSNVVASQVDVHRKYGGVVPELASREHLRHIVPVVREALERAGMRLPDVDAIGVTRGPGLVGALLVGLTYGKVLAQALGKPLVAVNHLEGHVHAVLLEAYRAHTQPEFPAVCLIVSGGHTLLYHVDAAPSVTDSAALQLRYRRLGGTRDDAAGEAYDKVARLLALGYPGGPILDQLARVERNSGNGRDSKRGASHRPGGAQFGTPKLRGNPLDFSFSGIKTAVLYYVRDHAEFAPEIAVRRAALREGKRSAAELAPLCSPATLDLVAEFQSVVVRDLAARTLSAARETAARSVLVSGGVAANSELRRVFEESSAARGLPVFFPSRALSTDNAAMIAAAAYSRLLTGERAGEDLDAEAVLPLA
ncbi:MAG: tRNA (adenosine(37)-N6)-threonylcarbamoyltransferase complex transferase subunit TsaD [Candidatus Acidiferrales bacterium]